jgi:hypothetical protein
MEMQDGMRGNPEESLKRALAEFAAETALGVASDRVRQRLQREVRARAHRRRAFVGLAAVLAAAAAVSAIVFGVTARRLPLVAPTQPQPVAQAARPSGGAVAGGAAAPAFGQEAVRPTESVRESGAVAQAASPGERSGAAMGRRPRGVKGANGSLQPGGNGEWRKGEIVLSPWYYNTALPPAARSVLVRSEVDARTAMRFGVAPAGDTAPVEILFGEDGLPRAMRFIRHLPTQTN